MNNIRPRFEEYFARLGERLFEHRLKAISFVLLLSFAFAWQIQYLAVDTSNEAYFLKNDPSLLNYESFRQEYGRDESIVIAIASDTVFDTAFLASLQNLHQDLQQAVPYIDEITSLVNVRDTRGRGDELIVSGLLDKLPQTDAELSALKQRVMQNPFYLDRLVTRDGKATLISIRPVVYLVDKEEDVLAGFDDMEADTGAATEPPLLSNPQYTEMTEAVKKVLENYQDKSWQIHVTGFPAVTDAIDQGIKRTMATLIPLSYALIVIFLFIMFRRMSGMVYPVLIVSLGAVTVMGMFPLFGATINNVSTIIPTFLTVVGVADSVHILAAFYHQYNKSDGSKQARKQAVSYAMRHSALAISMTSATTAAGLLSFSFADVAPVAEFGLMCALGALVMFVYSIVLLPALLSLVPLKPKPPAQRQTGDMLEQIAQRCATLAIQHPGKIVITALLLFFFAIFGVLQAKLSHNAIKWFDEDTEIRQATEFVDQQFGGSMVMEVLIDTGQKNGLYDPALLAQLDRSIDYVLQLRNDGADITNAMSVNTILKEINQALHGNDVAHYAIPNDRQLIAQELLLFESSGSDDLERIIDADFRTLRLTLIARFRDAVEYQPLVKAIEAHFQQAFPAATVTVTGEMSLLVKMVVNTLTTMAKSYTISIIVITLLMIFFIGELRLGLLSMVPNLVPLFLVIGIMGALDIPIDFSTVLLGSVAIGLVVDDTIHFMHHFRRYFRQSGDVEQAIHQTLHTAGRAIFVTSVVLAVSFYSFITAELLNTYYFGLLTGTAILIALLADFLITPALMVLLFRQRKA